MVSFQQGVAIGRASGFVFFPGMAHSSAVLLRWWCWKRHSGGHPVGWRNPACKMFKKFGLAGTSNTMFSSKYIYIYVLYICLMCVCVFYCLFCCWSLGLVKIKVTIVFVFLLVPSSPASLLRGRQGGQVAGKDQQVFQEDPVCPCSSPRVSWQNFVGCVTVWWTDSFWRGEATLMRWWHMEKRLDLQENPSVDHRDPDCPILLHHTLCMEFDGIR